MAIKIDAKKAIVEGVKESIKSSQSLVIAEYGGISVESLSHMRRAARANNVYLHVIRNTLAKRAVEGTPFEALKDKMTGQLIYAFSDDPVAAPKVVHDFNKTNPTLVIKGGFYDGKILDESAIAELAKIPSHDELIAKLLGVMQAPVSGFARALAALAEKKAAEGEQQPAA